ncbi:MAG: hypothetical protein IPK63_18405 [Candidatus Competibacteraceae bacterium]|nr:hypothetical protein [Candidatus Competibacteraceae bacterium]
MKEKTNPYITAVRVERPATLADSDLRRADRDLLERYQAVMRLIDGDPAAQRNPDPAVIRDFVTGRTGGDAQATPLPSRPMATRNPPPRYNLIGIAASIALVVGSILAAAWLVMN